MPLYEYTCAGCDHRFEAFVHTSRAKVECPKCGGTRVNKLISLFGTKAGGSGSIPAPASDSHGGGGGT